MLLSYSHDHANEQHFVFGMPCSRSIKRQFGRAFDEWLGVTCKFKTVPPSGSSKDATEFAVFGELNESDLDKLRNNLDQVGRYVSGVGRATIEAYDERPYLKLIIERQAFIESVINLLRHGIKDYRSISSRTFKPKKQIIEFSSPNIAKPFHCGHLRSTIIGNALANINSFLGHSVVRLNYLGDWGTQFGLLSQGFQDFGDFNELKLNPIKHLFEVYVEANKKAENEPEYFGISRSKFTSLEKNRDPDLLKLWRQFRDLSIEEYKKVYESLGITFNEFHFESSYDEAARHWVHELEKLGIVKTSEDGAKYFEIPTRRDKSEAVILLKNDGSTLYLSRDIAAAIERKEKYDFDEMFYVVGRSQGNHFWRLKNILTRMDKEWAQNLHHVVFGEIRGMSTRKGTVVLLQDIIDEAKSRCKESTLKSITTKSSADKHEDLATSLGMSAVFVHDLKNPKGVHYDFNWDNALKLTGHTGIYLQYAHARINSIKEKCGIELDRNCTLDSSAFDESNLWNRLFVQLSQFDDVVALSSEKCEPSILVRYLLWLSHRCNACIENYPVKGSPEAIARTRLLVFNCSQEILKTGMKLIGLKPLDII